MCFVVNKNKIGYKEKRFENKADDELYIENWGKFLKVHDIITPIASA